MRNKELAEKTTQLNEKNAQLNASIKLMLSQNIPIEVIAKALGVSPDEIKEADRT